MYCVISERSYLAYISMNLPSQDSLIANIIHKLHSVERLLIDFDDKDGAKTLLHECSANVGRIRAVMSDQNFNNLNNSIVGLLAICNSAQAGPSHTDTSFSSTRVQNGWYITMFHDVITLLVW